MTETEIDRIISHADWYVRVDATSGLAHHLRKYWPEIKAEITKLRAERDAAASIFLGCATQYPYASGLTVTDDPHEGYGPLKEARLFIERHGCATDHAELNKWPRYRGAAALVATDGKDAT